jgi:hypothetical protein
VTQGIKEVQQWDLFARSEVCDATHEPARRDDASVRGEVDATDGRLATEQILREDNGRPRLPKREGEAADGRRDTQRVQDGTDVSAWAHEAESA